MNFRTKNLQKMLDVQVEIFRSEISSSKEIKGGGKSEALTPFRLFKDLF